MAIADEVRAALIEAGTDVSGASLVLSFVRDNRSSADDVQSLTTYDVVAMDNGIKKYLPEGSTDPVAMRRITIPAGEYTPSVGDRVTIGGLVHSVVGVQPVAPFGVPVMYKLFVNR